MRENLIKWVGRTVGVQQSEEFPTYESCVLHFLKTRAAGNDRLEQALRDVTATGQELRNLQAKANINYRLDINDAESVRKMVATMSESVVRYVPQDLQAKKQFQLILCTPHMVECTVKAGAHSTLFLDATFGTTAHGFMLAALYTTMPNKTVRPVAFIILEAESCRIYSECLQAIKDHLQAKGVDWRPQVICWPQSARAQSADACHQSHQDRDHLHNTVPRLGIPQSIITDADLKLGNAIMDVLGCPQFICSFHVLRAMLKNLNAKKGKVDANTSNRCYKELVNVMYYLPSKKDGSAQASVKTKFRAWVEKWAGLDMNKFTQYVEYQWGDELEQWCMGLKPATDGHTTNNALESTWGMFKDLLNTSVSSRGRPHMHRTPASGTLR